MMSSTKKKSSNPFAVTSVLKFLASLKLAVFVILAIGLITAVGTFVEAKYDAYAARKMVYDTFWMYGIMLLLAINLIAVMVDRWPWKVRHLPFLAAHVGIIFLLIGSVITAKYGVDGSMRIGIRDRSQYVTMPETDLVMYATFDGDRYAKVFDQPVDFFVNPPTVEKPIVLPTTSNDTIQLVDYVKYGIPLRKVVESRDEKRGAGLRFQLKNANVNTIEWMIQKNNRDPLRQRFGLATLILGDMAEKGRGENEIYFRQDSKGQLQYAIFHKDQEKAYAKGVIHEGDSVPTGWMGMDLKLVRFLPKAQEEWDLQFRDHPTPLTSPAVKVLFRDKTYWLLQNDILKLFTDQGAYLLGYQNRRLDLGFGILLKEFQVTHYKGTMKAMQYESLVSFPGTDSHVISMNEPLKYSGYTFYQASFENNEVGQPVASVLSVNRDPGRWLKYLGSLIMSLGIVLMFWFKKIGLRKTAIPMVRDPGT